MREVNFYRTADGRCPVREFLDGLSSEAVTKIGKVLEIIRNMDVITVNYFKHLKGTEFYECRIEHLGNSYRLLGFFYEGSLIILTNGFAKKSQKTPKKEIRLCRQRMKDFIARGGK